MDQLLRRSRFSSGTVAFQNAFWARAVQNHFLKHLLHLSSRQRRNYSALICRMKSNGLRRALRIELSGHNSRRDQHTVIPNARHHRRQLNCGDADFLPHRNRADGDFGPSIRGFVMPRVSPGSSIPVC